MNTRPDKFMWWFVRWGLIIAIVLIVLAGALFNAAIAAEPIPEYSLRYRAALVHAVIEQFGLEANVALLAAQIHEESNWEPRAASAYAQGLSQFTRPTAKWLPTVCPDVGEPDPWNADWSIRAIACYDHYLYVRAPGLDDCNRWAFTLSDYNGGQGNRAREQRMAAENHDDPLVWWAHVEKYNRRSASAWRENRGYVRDILLKIEPVYLDAGWPGTGACM
jgi:membrane-bound lytic murein transglycosylase MltF